MISNAQMHRWAFPALSPKFDQHEQTQGRARPTSSGMCSSLADLPLRERRKPPNAYKCFQTKPTRFLKRAQEPAKGRQGHPPELQDPSTDLKRLPKKSLADPLKPPMPPQRGIHKHPSDCKCNANRRCYTCSFVRPAGMNAT